MKAVWLLVFFVAAVALIAPMNSSGTGGGRRGKRSTGYQPNRSQTLPGTLPGSWNQPQVQPPRYPGSAGGPQVQPGRFPGSAGGPQVQPGRFPGSVGGSQVQPGRFPGSSGGTQVQPGRFPGSSVQSGGFPGYSVQPSRFPGSSGRPQGQPGRFSPGGPSRRPIGSGSGGGGYRGKRSARIGGPVSTSRRACVPGAVRRVNCNTCTCGRNGFEACTLRACIQN